MCQEDDPVYSLTIYINACADKAAFQQHMFSRRKYHPEMYNYHVVLVQTQIVNPVPFPVHRLPKCLDEQVSCKGARKDTCMSGTRGYSANLKESQERDAVP